MVLHRRVAIRLRGYDYASPGSYFVTICTRDHLRPFGEIVDGTMVLSDTGQIADECWRDIPVHFPNVRADAYCIMPNHVHGMIEIIDASDVKRGEKPYANATDTVTRVDRDGMRVGVGARHDAPLRAASDVPGDGAYPAPFTGERFGKPRPGSLSTIVRSYKSAVMKRIHDRGLFPHISVWQSRYYDVIIRDARAHFCIARYIRLNPVVWMLDSDNPAIHRLPMDEFRQSLKGRFGFEEPDLDYLQGVELKYRRWKVSGGIRT